MNENNGFIVINRKILNWEWYQDTNTVRLFLHLLLIANWEDKKWKGIEIRRGQIVTSLKHLSQQTKMTVQQVRTSINKLISTNEITKKTTNKFTVISIKNYNKYQDYNKQDNKRTTNEQQTNNKQITTTKQYNNITNKQYISTTIVQYVEENFGRTLSPVEYEEILSWEDCELTRYAIKQAVLLNKISTKYISRILSAYERENIKTVQQAQERERQYNIGKSKRYVEKIPNWFNKEIKTERKLSDEELQWLESIK